jgi:hypothetical protein
MSKVIVRYCHPCKSAGTRTRCGLGKSGIHFDRRSRCEGAIVNVCDFHGDALDVLRAEVSGISDKSAPIGQRTTSVRQSAEGALFDIGAATVAAGKREALETSRARALDMITPDMLAKIVRASRFGKGQTFIADDMMRDARYDAIMDALVRRLGDRAFRGEEIDIDAVIMVALFSNTSERARKVDLRLDARGSSYDMGTGADAPTLGAILTTVLLSKDDEGDDIQRDLLREALREISADDAEMLLSHFVDDAPISDAVRFARIMADVRSYCGV